MPLNQEGQHNERGERPARQRYDKGRAREPNPNGSSVNSGEKAWDGFCAVVPAPTVGEPEGLAAPAAVLREGEVAWEDHGSLQWNPRMAK